MLEINSPFIANRIFLITREDFRIFRSKMEVFRSMIPEMLINQKRSGHNEVFSDEIGESIKVKFGNSPRFDPLKIRYDGLIDFMIFSTVKSREQLILFFRTINDSGASIDGAIYLTSPQVFKILDNISEEEIKRIDEQYEMKESNKSKEFDPLGERLKAFREKKPKKPELWKKVNSLPPAWGFSKNGRYC